MKYQEEISSSEDKFNFSSVTNEITFIHKLLVHGEEDGSNEDSDEVKGVRRRKIRLIDSESESENNFAVEIEPSIWTKCTESEEMITRIPFVSDERPVGPKVSLHIKEPIDFFKLFFIEESVTDSTGN